MVNGLDYWMMCKKESTYGTAVVVDKAVELAGASVKPTEERAKGKSLRSGNRFGAASMAPVVFRSAGADINVNACSKSQGALWEMALGSASSALVSGSDYQQTYKMADSLPSYTMQFAAPLYTTATGAWSHVAHTLHGVVCTGWELSLANGGILDFKLSLNARRMVRDVAQATPSFATLPAPYTFAGACLYYGTVAEPAATALISTAGLTVVANAVSFNLKVDNAQSIGEKRMCAAGLQARPLSGLPVGSGTIITDYVDSNALQDLYWADSAMTLVMDFVGASSVNDHLQVLVQDVRLKGDIEPQPNDGKPLIQTLAFDCFDKSGQTSPIIVIQRTTDTAV